MARRYRCTRLSLGVPTWFYGHEPPNLFATRIAKFFTNALREDVREQTSADDIKKMMDAATEGRGHFLGIWALFSNVGVLGGPLMISALVKFATVQSAVFSIGGVALAGAVWMVTFARRIGLPSGVRP